MRAANRNPIIVAFSRDLVTTRNMVKAMAMLKPLLADRETILQLEGSVSLAYTGWDDDPREIWEIPEIRRFMKKLTAQFPYWFWYIRKDDDSFKLLLSVLVSGVRSARPVEPDSPWGKTAIGFEPNIEEIPVLLRKLFDGLNTLTESHQIPESENEAVSMEINNLVNLMLDGD